jgi:hypothetical protein
LHNKKQILFLHSRFKKHAFLTLKIKRYEKVIIYPSSNRSDDVNHEQ